MTGAKDGTETVDYLYDSMGRMIERDVDGSGSYLIFLPFAPKRRRVSGIPWQTVELICELRRKHPAWSKHKIAAVLARDHGISLSSSTAGRIMKRKSFNSGWLG